MPEKKKVSEHKAQWRWYTITFAFTPMLMLVACLYLRREGWISLDLTVVALLFAGYWFAAIAVAGTFIGSIFTPWAVVWGSIPVAITLVGWFWPEDIPEDRK